MKTPQNRENIIMIKKINTIILSLILIISLASSAWCFESNANRVNPSDNNDKRLRQYTRENAAKPLDQGGYYGGHDTIMGEAALLKKEVHGNNQDFKTWLDEQALPNLRTGAHDEDSKKYGIFGYLGGEVPIGPNSDGDYFKHFYNPDTGKGWFGSDSAVQRAKDYVTEIKKKLCITTFCDLKPDEQKKVLDYIGRIGHLIADMAVPEHLSNNFHGLARGGWIESHTLKNWDKVINSQVFKDKVDKSVYNNENNKYNKVDLDNPKEVMDNLTNITPDIYTHYDFLVPYCDGTLCGYKFSEELLNKAIASLVSEATLYTAGLIDSAYDKLSNCTNGIKCKLPPVPVGPGGDHPDDRFDVSDGFYWEQEFKISDYDLTNLYLRTAMKKGKIGVWYKKLFMDKFAEGSSKLDTATEEEINLINSELKALWEKLEQRRPQEDSDWKGAPDIALFANGFYKPSISLMLKYQEPVSFQKADFDPAIVKDHPVMLVPTGGFYGLETSAVAKASLDEYVKNGGTLVVFAQQHGSDWGLLPVPQDPVTRDI